MSEANTPNNPAEEKVLKAFRDGEKEVIVHPDGIPSHLPSLEDLTKEHIPAIKLTSRKPTAKDWQGEDAIIRAHFLRNLFLGNHGKFNPRLVTISCARIEGVLDLSYCESLFPLSFFWCIFSKGISLQAAIVPELALAKCLIGQTGQPSNLYAPQVQVITNVSLSDQFIAYGGVYLHSANIGGQLSCDGGHFEQGMIAQSLETGGAVFLCNDFRSSRLVDLTCANIGGQLICEGGHFEEGLIAQHLRARECVLLRSGFRSNGRVDLLAANIGGPLDCTGGYFKEGLIADRLKTGEDVLLMDKFESSGKVDMSGASIGGQLSCTGGIFGKGLFAQNLKIDKDMFLRGKFESYEIVDLNGANIGGQLDCSGGHFKKGLFAQNLKTGKDVFLMTGFKSSGVVNLNGANIGGQLSCPDGYFENGLNAYGLCYQSIDFGGDWKKALDWLQQIRGDGLQPYEQLMTVYRRMGKPDWAREIGFELEKKKHRQFIQFDSGSRENQPLKKARLIGVRAFVLFVASFGTRLLYGRTFSFFEKSLWCIWYSVLRLTIGYGYKPFRSLGWAAGLVTAGFLLFSSGHDGIVSKVAPSYLNTPAFLGNTFLANEWIPSEDEALKHWGEKKQVGEKGQAPQDYPKFNPFIYSLEATLPVLPLGQLNKWHPSSWVLLGVRWIWTFTGSALLAILALFGVGVLRPTWKSEGDGG